MPHVITQSCCSDGSCVYACPVNCIHPSPDEPGFATAEMLYIDPAACVDCGACVSACPVGAISTASKLGRFAVHRAQRVVLSDAATRREAAADLEAGAGDRGAEHQGTLRWPAHRGHRRVGAGRDVRRRRAVDAEGRAGQRLREVADALRPGPRRRCARPSEHQAGHPAVRRNDAVARVLVLPERRDRSARQPRRTAGAPSRGALRRRCTQRSSARRRGHRVGRQRHGHRDGGLDQRPSRVHRPARRSEPRTGGRHRQRQRRPRRGAHPDHRPGRPRPHRHRRPRPCRAARIGRAGGRHRGAARPGGVGVHAAGADRADREVRRGARRGRPRTRPTRSRGSVGFA